MLASFAAVKGLVIKVEGFGFGRRTELEIQTISFSEELDTLGDKMR